MSPPVYPPSQRIGTPPALPLLREPDVSGLALWAALFVAGSVLLAFLATEPAHAVQAATAAAAVDDTERALAETAAAEGEDTKGAAVPR